MAISLYDMSVPTYLQTLGAVSGFMDKGLAHCKECNTEPGQVVEHRLFQDMAPFSFQIRSVAHHSFGALEALKSGVFNPPGKADPLDYAGLQKLVADTRGKLEALKPDEVNALEGKDVAFQFGETKSRSPPKPLCCRSRCPTFISTPPRPTTSCAPAACRSASGITWAGCGSRSERRHQRVDAPPCRIVKRHRALPRKSVKRFSKRSCSK